MEAATRTGTDSPLLEHIWCCDPTTALCGADTTGAIDDGHANCVVCIDLADTADKQKTFHPPGCPTRAGR